MTDYTPPAEAVEAFKAAWHEADAEGDAGNRVLRGLTAAGPLIAAQALREAAETLRAEDMGHDRWYADGLEHRADRIVRLARGEGA